VDSRAGALTEAGDIVGPIREGAITERHIVAEIGEVFAGRHPGRERDGDITLFKSLGMAVEDVAAARFAYARARARDIGEEIRLE
jgi:ornithine cyclodeaminase/alanine dehydrogenase-like protein (mu-crystallin family)